MPCRTHATIRDFSLDAARRQSGFDNLSEGRHKFRNTDHWKIVHGRSLAIRDFWSKILRKQEFGTGGNRVIRRSIQNMDKTITIRITLIRTAVFAVSVVVALLTSGRCNASCGEYVYSRYRTATHQVPKVAMNEHDNLKPELVRLSEAFRMPHESLPSMPLPCNGPNCQRSPTPFLPVAPPTAVPGGHQDRLICGKLTVELPSEESRRRDLDCHARALRGFPLLIEMPPEFVS